MGIYRLSNRVVSGASGIIAGSSAEEVRYQAKDAERGSCVR